MTRPSRWAGLGLALALVASACGSQSTPIEASSSATDTAGTAGESPAGSGEGGESAGPEVVSDAEEVAEEGAEGPVPGDHLFPDLDTVNIVDGSSLNLAQELAGGDTPVLLWFWAPH